jgi:hypothetical protein
MPPSSLLRCTKFPVCFTRRLRIISALDRPEFLVQRFGETLSWFAAWIRPLRGLSRPVTEGLSQILPHSGFAPVVTKYIFFHTHLRSLVATKSLDHTMANSACPVINKSPAN